jgi:glutamyl-tRNA reductase
MSLLAVGMSHRTAPTELLELASIPAADLGKLLRDLVDSEQVSEGVVLSTCNRVEVYVDVLTFHGGVAEVSDLLARACGVPLDELTPHLSVHHEARAVQHLFSVACGLDSMLVGEAQILGQVRTAFRTAEGEGAVGRVLGDLFRAALRVGKRVRTETAIDGAGASLVSVAIQLAEDTLGSLAGRSALLVGAGSTGALAGGVLRQRGIGDLVIANRTPERADRLASNLTGRAVGLGDLVSEFVAADVVVSSTGATGVVIPASLVEHGQLARGDRPLVLVDLALPHDVEPAAGELPGVTVIDLNSIRTYLERTAGQAGAGQIRAGEVSVKDVVEQVRALVAAEVDSYLDHQRALKVAPTVVALRARAAEVVEAELGRLDARLPDLTAEERNEVDVAVRRVVEKLLHTPTVRVQQLAEAPGGDSYAEALQELFGLGRSRPAAVSVTDPRDVP